MITVWHPRRAGAVAAVCAAVLMAGCGRTKTVPAAGTVTLDGVPLADGAITFVRPANGGVAGGGAVKDGAFAVRLPPGAYRVAITASRPVPGKFVPGMGNTPVVESIVPARYNSESKLTAEVADGGPPLAFALESKPPPTAPARR